MCSDSLAESYSESASIFAIAPFLRWYLSIASYRIPPSSIALHHHRSHRIIDRTIASSSFALYHRSHHRIIIVRIVSSIAPSHHHRSFVSSSSIVSWQSRHHRRPSDHINAGTNDCINYFIGFLMLDIVDINGRVRSWLDLILDRLIPMVHVPYHCFKLCFCRIK
jgi:hypothetical protein